MRLAALRIPSNLLHDLESVAKQLQRTKSFVIRKAIETYVHEYADYQIALDRLNDKDDEIISFNEVRGLVERKHKIKKICFQRSRKNSSQAERANTRRS